MKIAVTVVLSVLGLALTGCGGGGDAEVMPPPVAPPQAQPAVDSVASSAPAQVNTAPPTGTAPATLEVASSDGFSGYKTSRDGSPDKSDLQAMQAIVDAYAFGPEGLGAPPLNTLDDLVTKGFLKKLPAPPAGMKWGYDSPTWKVSLVPQ